MSLAFTWFSHELTWPITILLIGAPFHLRVASSATHLPLEMCFLADSFSLSGVNSWEHSSKILKKYSWSHSMKRVTLLLQSHSYCYILWLVSCHQLRLAKTAQRHLEESDNWRFVLLDAPEGPVVVFTSHQGRFFHTVLKLLTTLATS